MAKIKNAYTEAVMNVLGRRKKKCQSWISTESWRKIEERRKLKRKINDARSERLKNKPRNEYSEKIRRQRGASGRTKETG